MLADGRPVSTEDDPELLWALRGGGNFGLVTSKRVRLLPDHGLSGGMVLFPFSAGRDPGEGPTVYRNRADDVSTALAPLALPGGYSNFLAPDQDEQIAHAYGTHADRLINMSQIIILQR
ncbi:hypothetical protein [Nonomuraea phyllanthi]|uniref:hypothetical protein n=1 Tax=Nonomuraea phyllanthi TaxID=2219224 RepID=UPI0018858C0A|nr:hypothetical protein [Nonomuraea phyllanthi]